MIDVRDIRPMTPPWPVTPPSKDKDSDRPRGDRKRKPAAEDPGAERKPDSDGPEARIDEYV